MSNKFCTVGAVSLSLIFPSEIYNPEFVILLSPSLFKIDSILIILLVIIGSEGVKSEGTAPAAALFSILDFATSL